VSFFQKPPGVKWLKKLSQSDPPKTAFFKSIEEKGTISDFKNVAEHARNVQQIKNIKKISMKNQARRKRSKKCLCM